jgi:hypothetical protein
MTEILSFARSELMGSLPQPIDWNALRSRESTAGEFLVPGLLPAGRQVSVYARAKEGKSLLALDIALNLATGGNLFGEPNTTGSMSVIYLDMEMTEQDLLERLTDFGYDQSTDLTYLHYFLLPELAPLNTVPGARALEHLVDLYEPRLVIIDTLGRFVEGDENSSDTIRGFYKNTGVFLKKMGVSLLRLDHEGKDSSNGSRGSSAKNEDVDVVWRLSRSSGQVTLKRQFSRVSWVPESVSLKLSYSEETLSHTLVDTAGPSSATLDIVELLVRLEVPTGSTLDRTTELLKVAGYKKRRQDISSAIRYMKGAEK